MAIDTAHRPTPNTGAAPRVIPPRQRFRRRSIAADLLVAVCWASAAIAVALFLATGGTSQFSGIANITTSLGIVAGLIGTDLVLVMLVLAARLPFIDRTVGHDRAMATHRSLGKPALYLLLAHGVLLLIGYGMSAGFSPIAEIGQLWAIPDMPLAFIGLGLLVLVVITSLVAVRRKFPYEVWHVIHLLSYAAVIVALPHQLSVGGMLATGPARVYWIALYAAALGSIGVFRFIVPTVRSLRHDIRVTGVEVVAPGVFSIHLGGRQLRALRSAGGQFFVWRFWTGSTWWHSHPISLSAVPTDTSARITVRELGKGTGRLSTLPVGTRVSIEGPYGLFTDAARTSPRLAVVAAGIGITPIRALLEQSPLARGEATVLLRGRSVEELYLLPEIEALADRSETRVYTSVGSRGNTVRPWLSAADAERGVSLRSVFPHLLQSDLYICGPLPWTTLVEAEALAAGMPAHQIHSERFEL
ncbi:ferric reductase-like transmembrane domain-containing protein [soil metagenome]